MQPQNIINHESPILITGAAGFIGARVVQSLLKQGFRKIRCLVRPSSELGRLQAVVDGQGSAAKAEVIKGNLLSPKDCLEATQNVEVVYHLAAGTGTKSFADAFMNSVVTTRNLLDAVVQHECLKRFVNLSSFAVYSNRNNPLGNLLDESAPVESHPASRAEAYCYAKVKQDELVMDYGLRKGVRYVLLRPGVVYGPGKDAISGRVGTNTFGFFVHLGGRNHIPFTYVDNCAEAIVLAGVKPGIEGEVFNVVDDDLPTSSQFLRLYKKNVKQFRSFYVPHVVSYLFCYLWEKYSRYSEEQLPPTYSRREWTAYWKPTRYSNEKLKRQLGWSPKITTSEGFRLFFEACLGRRKGA